MKSIIVDIDEKDLDELGINSEHISFRELKRQLLVKSMREKREQLEVFNKMYGFDKLSEGEIFDMLNEDEEEFNAKKKHPDSNAKNSD